MPTDKLTDEERAAVERLIEYWSRNYPGNVQLEKLDSIIFILQKAAASLPPSDDAEPVDEAWLRSASPRKSSGKYIWLNADVNLNVETAEVYCGGCLVCRIESREQYRALLKALNLPLATEGS